MYNVVMEIKWNIVFLSCNGLPFGNILGTPITLKID